MDFTLLIFIMFLSGMFPLAGYYFDWKDKQAKKNRKRPTLPKGWRKKKSVD